MHLEYYAHYRPSPARWKVIDDFGTVHDTLSRHGDFGDIFDAPHRQRVRFIESQLEDPDYFRLDQAEPQFHRLDESTAFVTPFGLSIEAELSIGFRLIPHWDEAHGEAHFTRDKGARIAIGWARVYGVEFSYDPVALSQPELLEYCWQYLDLQRAREVAEKAAAAAAQMSGAAQ